MGTDWGRTSRQAGRKERKGKSQVTVSPTQVLLGCSEDRLSGRPEEGIRYPGSTDPRRQSNGWRVRARVSPACLPDTLQLGGRHLMAKVEEAAASSRRAQPLCCLSAAPSSRSSFPKCSNFFQALDAVCHDHGRSPPAAGETLHLTRRPQFRAASASSPFPSPAALGAWGSRGGG